MNFKLDIRETFSQLYFPRPPRCYVTGVFVLAAFLAVDVQRPSCYQTSLTAYVSYYGLIPVHCRCSRTGSLSKASGRNTTSCERG